MNRRSRSQLFSRLPLRIRVGLICGVASLILLLIAGRVPQLIESLYSRTLYPPIARSLALLTSWLPISLAELSFIAVGLLLIASPVLAFTRARRSNAPLSRALGRSAIQLLGEAGWVWTVFLLLWGLNYARAPVARVFDLHAGPTAVGQRQLIAQVGERLDLLRASLEEDENGVLIGIRSRQQFEQVDDQIRELQAEALNSLGLSGMHHGRTKRVISSPLLLRWGVSGVYGPFTGEPNIVMPCAVGKLPFIIAHERAHLSGFAWEEAASFVAFVTLWRAEDPLLRYSAWLELWMILGGTPRDRSPAVQRDLKAIRDFYIEHVGREAPAVRKVYSAYLRAHGVKGGVASYSRAGQLALAYLNRHGFPPG